VPYYAATVERCYRALYPDFYRNADEISFYEFQMDWLLEEYENVLPKYGWSRPVITEFPDDIRHN